VANNPNPRINGSEIILEAIHKIAEDDSNATIALLQVSSYSGDIELLHVLLGLDNLAIYGSRVTEFYKKCGEHPTTFIQKISEIERGCIELCV
jgi:hypothetical protein